MEIKIHRQQIRVYDEGIKLLRLKTKVSLRIGKALTSGKGYIAFPVSSLILVKDLLPQHLLSEHNIERELSTFTKHEAARSKAISIICGEVDTRLSDYWHSTLDPEQLSATSAMIVEDLLGLCLFDEQGSGKTVMTIAAFDILKSKKEIDGMIVVCPKSMVNEWGKSFDTFCKGQYNVEIAKGSSKEKYDIAMKEFDVLITNYEGVEALHGVLISTASSRKYLLVVDESFYLKNSESERSKFTTLLRQSCKRCYVLCGTPAPNSAHDLINQFDLADIGYTFGGFKKSKDPELDWPKMDALIDSRGLFIRRLKSDILEHVPEKNFHVSEVVMSGKQQQLYETARNELVLELKKLNNESFKRSLANYFQKRSALLQICTCPEAIDPTYSEIPAKFHVLDKLLDDLVGQGRKVVVWSFYRDSINDILSRYKKYSPVSVDGSTTDVRRSEAINMFQEDPNTMLFVGNPAAAGAGITLHSSFNAVYFSYSNQAAHYLQSLDRIHRRGQVSDQVNYYLMICTNTIEQTEVSRLRGKEINQHTLLGDHIKWPTSLDDALEELNYHE